VHVWTPTANKSKFISPSNRHWVRCIYICQMAPPPRVDATIWVAECEYSEEGIQVSHPRKENSLNPGWWNLNRWKLRLILKILYTVLYVYLNWFCHNSLLKCVLQLKIAKKIHKNLYFGIQGHPRSLNSVAIESQCLTSYWWLIVA